MRYTAVLFILAVCLCGCEPLNSLNAAALNLNAAAYGATILGPLDRIHVGMTLEEVWEVYGVGPQKAGRIPIAHEETVGPRLLRTFRCWLKNPQVAEPFLLTFESKLPNYDQSTVSSSADFTLVRILRE